MAVLLCISYWHTYSQPPASPSTQEAIQGMLSMANLSSSESLQQPWSNSQAKNNGQSKNNSHSSQAGKKAGRGGGGNNSKRSTKRLPKKPRKSSSIESLDYDDDQDHMDACFKDSDYGKRQMPTCCCFLIFLSSWAGWGDGGNECHFSMILVLVKFQSIPCFALLYPGCVFFSYSVLYEFISHTYLLSGQNHRKPRKCWKWDKNTNWKDRVCFWMAVFLSLDHQSDETR